MIEIPRIHIPISRRTKRRFLIWKRRFWANDSPSIHFRFHLEALSEVSAIDILSDIVQLISSGYPVQVTIPRGKRINDIQMIAVVSDKGIPILRIIHRKSSEDGRETTVVHSILSRKNRTLLW